MAPLVDLVLWDVNGVLYDYDPDVRVEVFAGELGTSADAVGDALFTSGLEAASDAGEIDPGAYLAQLSRRLGREVGADDWAAALGAAVAPRPDLLRILAAVAKRVRCATLSNNGLMVGEMVDRIYPELLALGVEVHVAAEYGESKPDRDVYLDACASLGVEPARTAFVDDKDANAAGAASAGLHAHHFVSREGLVAFLIDLGIDPRSAPGDPA